MKTLDKAIIEYHIPIQSAERVDRFNKMLKEPIYKTTEEHIEILIDKLVDAIEKVGDAGGWYTCDSIKVKIELEYEPEDK